MWQQPSAKVRRVPNGIPVAAYAHRPEPDVLPRLIKDEARPGDVVVLLGAGDITSWAYGLPAQLEALA